MPRLPRGSHSGRIAGSRRGCRAQSSAGSSLGRVRPWWKCHSGPRGVTTEGCPPASPGDRPGWHTSMGAAFWEMSWRPGTLDRLTSRFSACVSELILGQAWAVPVTAFLGGTCPDELSRHCHHPLWLGAAIPVACQEASPPRRTSCPHRGGQWIPDLYTEHLTQIESKPGVYATWYVQCAILRMQPQVDSEKIFGCSAAGCSMLQMPWMMER